MKQNKVMKLTKNSSPEQIDTYCDLVLKLPEDFPVDLDDVWAIAYESKSTAIQIISENFVQDCDYIIEPVPGFKRKLKYKLNLSCLPHILKRAEFLQQIKFIQAVRDDRNRLMKILVEEGIKF